MLPLTTISLLLSLSPPWPRDVVSVESNCNFWSSFKMAYCDIVKIPTGSGVNSSTQSGVNSSTQSSVNSSTQSKLGTLRDDSMSRSAALIPIALALGTTSSCPEQTRENRRRSRRARRLVSRARMSSRTISAYYYNPYYYNPYESYYGYGPYAKYWYYCSDPAGYYPYVTQCNTGRQPGLPNLYGEISANRNFKFGQLIGS